MRDSQSALNDIATSLEYTCQSPIDLHFEGELRLALGKTKATPMVGLNSPAAVTALEVAIDAFIDPAERHRLAEVKLKLALLPPLSLSSTRRLSLLAMTSVLIVGAGEFGCSSAVSLLKSGRYSSVSSSFPRSTAAL